MFNLLEGDGVIENIYHLLWTKDSIFGIDPYVIIPHTILYKYQKPCYWYFTSKVDNKLKKKSSVKLTNEHIKEVFLKKVSKSGIIAYYIYKKYGNTSKYEIDHQNKYQNVMSVYQNNLTSNKEENNFKEGSYIVEYFDKKRFLEFLTSKSTYEEGILQKFEDPKGEHNSTIRLIWSPKLCIFEKNSNNKKINDTRFNIYERAVTYDGEEFQTHTEALKGNSIPDRIEKLGMNIANHISNITLERIKIVRMVLNFKITNDDRIVFLWCSSLRIDNSLDRGKKEDHEKHKEFDITKIKLSVPDNINLFKFSNIGKPIKPTRDSICLNCDRHVESYKLYEINFKTLMESHENRKRDKNYFTISGNINMTSSGIEIIPYVENKNLETHDKIKKRFYRNLLIPKVINSIYPKMKYEDYQILKRDDIFNSKTAFICEACFLDITRYCSFSGSNTENVLRQLGFDFKFDKFESRLKQDSLISIINTAKNSPKSKNRGNSSEIKMNFSNYANKTQPNSFNYNKGSITNTKSKLPQIGGNFELDELINNHLKSKILKKSNKEIKENNLDYNNEKTENINKNYTYKSNLNKK